MPSKYAIARALYLVKVYPIANHLKTTAEGSLKHLASVPARSGWSCFTVFRRTASAYDRTNLTFGGRVPYPDHAFSDPGMNGRHVEPDINNQVPE